MFNAWSTVILVAHGMMQVKYVNDRQQVVYIINGQRTVEQGPLHQDHLAQHQAVLADGHRNVG